jgi:tetratricopeptide (TPR) repeat protein
LIPLDIEQLPKILWKDSWKEHVEEIKKKDFFSFTFGECLEIFKLIKKEGMKKYGFYCDIGKEVLDLLDKHLSLRTDVSHPKKIISFKGEEPKELQREILKIMYSLLPFFPLCFKVESTFYKPYHATLLWQAYPKDVNIRIEIELEEDEIYYMDQKSVEDLIQINPDERDIEPEVVTTATSLKEYLEIKNEFPELTPFVKKTYGKMPEELSQMVPEDAAGWLMKASSLYKLGKYEETIECLNEYLELEPKSALALSNKADALANLESPLYEEALTYFDKSLKLVPGNAVTWRKKGTILYKLKNYDGALKHYEKALELAPSYAPALWGKGDALFKLGRWNDALEYYNKALEFDHENIFVLIKKGETLNRLYNYNDALECFDTALKLDPNNVIALHNKGFILGKRESKEDLDNALECLEKVLEIDPEHELAWKNKAIILSKIPGRSEEAIKCFDKAIEYFEKKPDSQSELARLWAGKGMALSYLKKHDNALVCVDSALKLTNEDAFVWYVKGFVLSKMGRDGDVVTYFEEALKCFNEATKLNPKYIVAWNNEVVVLSKMGYDKDAIKWFDKILNALDSKYTPALINKGFSLVKLGNPKEAIECYNCAIKIDSDNATAWKNKGRAFENLKEYKEAIESYAEALKILEISSNKKFTSDVWINKGRAYENWGDKCIGADRKEKYENALECYESVLEIEPDKTDERKAWKNKGKVLKKLERDEEASECFKEISSKGRLMNILREIHKDPEDYKLFKQGFEAEFDYHTEKAIQSKEEQGALRKKFYDLLFMSLEEASEESPVETTAKIFKSCQMFCEDISGKELKDRLTIRFRHHIFSFFRDIIFGTGYHNIGPVESKEELNTLLEKFERTFGETGIETPSLEEIKEDCIRSEKYAEHEEKLVRIFGL